MNKHMIVIGIVLLIMVSACGSWQINVAGRESERTFNEQSQDHQKVKNDGNSDNYTDDVKNKNLNSYVLDIMERYPITYNDYPYLLDDTMDNYNGVTETLTYQGETLLKAHPSGNNASHCVGITFEVFFKAMQERNQDANLPEDDFNGMNWDELYDFVMHWYVAYTKDSHNIATAVENYGVGTEITNLEQAQPGDFADITRTNNTGHTVVFIDWIRENGEIIGITYWSSQGEGGIGYAEEYFSDSGRGDVIRDELIIARIESINEYD